MLDEFRTFSRVIAFSFLWIIIGSLFFFSFTTKTVTLANLTFPVPVASKDSLAVLFFRKVSHDLLPAGTEIVAGSPLASFSTEIVSSLFLSAIFLLPIDLILFLRYLAPALRPQEKKMIMVVIIPSFVLFVIGVLFGYLVVVPHTFSTLVEHAKTLGIPQLFFLDDFIKTVYTMLLVSGAIFLLPVFLPLLTFFGVVKARFWWEQWRVFVVIALVMTGILTNDGTGVTMMLLSVPMIACYSLGMWISTLVSS
jgi:sec-independent protein translocase protein TatC